MGCEHVDVGGLGGGEHLGGVGGGENVVDVGGGERTAGVGAGKLVVDEHVAGGGEHVCPLHGPCGRGQADIHP